MSLPSQKRDIAISANANLNLLLNHYVIVNSDGDTTIRDYEKFVSQLDDLVGSNEAAKVMMDQFQKILSMTIEADKKPTGFTG